MQKISNKFYRKVSFWAVRATQGALSAGLAPDED